MRHRLREGLFILSIATAVFLFVSFGTYHTTDPGWSSTGNSRIVLNWGGKAGAFFADIFLSIFGYMAYILPLLMVFATWLWAQSDPEKNWISLKDILFKGLGLVLIVLGACGLIALYMQRSWLLFPASAGGILGDMIALELTNIFNIQGSSLFLMTAFLCWTTLFSGLSWLVLIDVIGFYTTRLINLVLEIVKKKSKLITTENGTEKNAINIKPRVEPKIIEPKIANFQPKLVEVVNTLKSKPTGKKIESSVFLKPGHLPPLTLLNPALPSEGKAFSNMNFEELSQLVEQRLMDFGVEVKVVAVHPGPIITRFELELAPGIKVSKISGLAKDIARSLSAVSVRVVEVIPGKSVIGLEIPNENRELVTLRDILESQRYAQSRSPVSLVLGKDISGNPVVVDLTKMPHLLVAGTTGSGKSVSLNAMLLSMLFKSLPDQLRLILIDPKMLELSLYDGIPHLLTPVITDMKDAANALRWCVAEMDRRYRVMAALGVRNITSYNQKVNDAIKQGQPIPMPCMLAANEEIAKTHLEPFPIVVVVADELADMMMVVGKKVEDLIARIAQKARAAGIHLILATQRPSVDVITGLIKANIPTRIAFQVSSRIDSRTILDQQGAEQLLGHGDMLYLPPGAGMPIRIHGAYVADEEVHRVVAAWRTYGQPVYLNEVTQEVSEEGGVEGIDDGEADPLYDQAVRVVTETRRASISLVQRRLRIGYNRAARMMEDMESAGVVSS